MPLDTTIFSAADVFVSPAIATDGTFLGYRVQTLSGAILAVVRQREVAIAIAQAAHEGERLSPHLH